MTDKHGLSQMGLNSAKGFANLFVEKVNNIELMFHLSVQGEVEESLAEDFIQNKIQEIENNWKYFKSYIEQHDDMR